MYEFFERINALKRTLRMGWLEGGVNAAEAEDVAQHSFETAVITMVLSDSLDQEIDSERALKMAIVHDWAEAVTGDFSKEITEQIGVEVKEKIEERALKNLLEKGEISQKEEYLNLWREYSGEKSKEARLVKVADKLSILVEASNLVEVEKTSEKLEEIIKTSKENLEKHLEYFPSLTNMLKSQKRKNS